MQIKQWNGLLWEGGRIMGKVNVKYIQVAQTFSRKVYIYKSYPLFLPNVKIKFGSLVLTSLC